MLPLLALSWLLAQPPAGPARTAVPFPYKDDTVASAAVIARGLRLVIVMPEDENAWYTNAADRRSPRERCRPARRRSISIAEPMTACSTATASWRMEYWNRQVFLPWLMSAFRDAEGR